MQVSAIQHNGIKLSPLLLSIPQKEAEKMVENLENRFDTVHLSVQDAMANRRAVERLRALLEYYNA